MRKTPDLSDDEAALLRRVEEETAARLRAHNLRQAHARLIDARATLREVGFLVEGDAELAGRVATIVVNSIEPLMWKIETRVREERKT